MKELILFDLDGTLYDSQPILPDAYEKGMEALNLERPISIPSEEVILDQIGTPADEIYDNLFPDLSSDERSLLQEQIVQHLLEGIQSEEGQLLPGVPEVLEQLKNNYQLALVTNAQTAYMQTVLDTYSLNKYFERNYCIKDCPGGDKGDLVKRVLDELSVDSNGALLVGDRKSDFLAAQKTTVDFIGVKGNYAISNELGDSTVIEDLTELRNLDSIKFS